MFIQIAGKNRNIPFRDTLYIILCMWVCTNVCMDGEGAISPFTSQAHLRESEMKMSMPCHVRKTEQIHSSFLLHLLICRRERDIYCKKAALIRSLRFGSFYLVLLFRLRSEEVS